METGFHPKKPKQQNQTGNFRTTFGIEPPLDPEPAPLPEYSNAEANGLHQIEVEQATNPPQREVEYVWPEHVPQESDSWFYANVALARRSRKLSVWFDFDLISRAFDGGQQPTDLIAR